MFAVGYLLNLSKPKQTNALSAVSEISFASKVLWAHSVNIETETSVTAEPAQYGTAEFLTAIETESIIVFYGNRVNAGKVNLFADSYVTHNSSQSLNVTSGGSHIGFAQTLDFIGDSVIVVNNTATITDDAGMSYATRYDQVSTTIAYKAEAAPGSSESAAVWRVSKLVFGTDGDVTVTWSGGVSDFAYSWTNRASLSYS